MNIINRFMMQRHRPGDYSALRDKFNPELVKTDTSGMRPETISEALVWKTALLLGVMNIIREENVNWKKQKIDGGSVSFKDWMEQHQPDIVQLCDEQFVDVDRLQPYHYQLLMGKLIGNNESDVLSPAAQIEFWRAHRQWQTGNKQQPFNTTWLETSSFKNLYNWIYKHGSAAALATASPEIKRDFQVRKTERRTSENVRAGAEKLHQQWKTEQQKSTLRNFIRTADPGMYQWGMRPQNKEFFEELLRQLENN